MSEHKSEAERIAELEERMSLAEQAIEQMMPHQPIAVHIYDRTHGWSSAPNQNMGEVGIYGQWGQQGDGVWEIEPGDYLLLNTYDIATQDFGQVRWVQIRTNSLDHCSTPDGFAWLPVNPKVMDAEALYRELNAQSRTEVPVDDYTQGIWDGMKAEEEDKQAA